MRTASRWIPDLPVGTNRFRWGTRRILVRRLGGAKAPGPLLAGDPDVEAFIRTKDGWLINSAAANAGCGSSPKRRPAPRSQGDLAGAPHRPTSRTAPSAQTWRPMQPADAAQELGRAEYLRLDLTGSADRRPMIDAGARGPPAGGHASRSTAPAAWTSPGPPTAAGPFISPASNYLQKSVTTPPPFALVRAGRQAGLRRGACETRPGRRLRLPLQQAGRHRRPARGGPGIRPQGGGRPPHRRRPRKGAAETRRPPARRPRNRAGR